MVSWTYRCYGEGKPNLWQKWFDAQDKAVKSKHDSVFDILEQRQRHEWIGPHVKKLKGPGPDLWEVIVTKGVAWRIFGYFSGDEEFTVTGIGNHKGKAYDPREIIDTCRRRRTEIEQNKAKVVSCARPKTP